MARKIMALLKLSNGISFSYIIGEWNFIVNLYPYLVYLIQILNLNPRSVPMGLRSLIDIQHHSHLGYKNTALLETKCKSHLQES